jgi:hypothetical protein
VSTRDVQATVEGVAVDPGEVTTVGGEVVAAGDAVKFLGDWYRINDHTGVMPLLKFAYEADRGIDSDSPAGMAAMYAMLRDSIHPDEWKPFEYAAMDSAADAATLLAVVREATQKISARPTKRPSGSSAGSRPTSGRSKGSSSPTDTPTRQQGLVSVDELLDRSTG